MNWTASLLRNELKKQKVAYENRLNLLTEASLDVSNYLDLEEKLKQTESNLITVNENLTDLKKQAEKQEKEQAEQVKVKETQITKFDKKITASKELIRNLQKEIRTNQLYYQQQLRKVQTDYQEKLKKPLVQEQKQKQALVILANHRREQINTLQRELAQEKAALIILAKQKLNKQKEAKELLEQLEIKWDKQKQELQKEFTNLETEITKLKEKLTTVQKEKANQELELETATGKLQALEKIFQTQVLEIIRKNIIFRQSKDLKRALQQIKELMGWTGLVLPTDTASGTSSNTPAEREE